MPSPFRNYDAWLEKPYQDMLADADHLIDAFETWCAEHDIDFDVCDDDHPDHHIYQQWEMWWTLGETWLAVKTDREIADWEQRQQQQLVADAHQHGTVYTDWLTARNRTDDAGSAEEFLLELLWNQSA